MSLTLAALCDEMHRNAAVISVPVEMMPSCNAPNRGGLHLELTPDGTKYVLTYTEKNETDTLASSDDADTILEAVFDQLTENMAPAITETKQIKPENILATPSGDLRKMAIDLHLRTSAAQEALLGRLSSRWQERQAVRNAQRLKYIEDNFWP